MDGTWNVDTTVGSFADFSSTWAGYSIDKQLASIGADTAVGRTPDVSGSMTIEGNEVTDVDVDVNLTTLTERQHAAGRARRSRGAVTSSPPRRSR